MKLASTLAVAALVCWTGSGCRSGSTGGISPEPTGTAAPATAPPLTPGASRDAVCAAAARDASVDPWQRFGDAVPVEVGGLLYVLRGARADVEAAMAPLKLASPVSVDCPGGTVVTWLPGVRAGGPLDAAFTAGRVGVQERLVFSPSAGRSWLEARCVDAAACCRQTELRCRFASSTEQEVRACVRTASGAPPHPSPCP